MRGLLVTDLTLS